MPWLTVFWNAAMPFASICLRFDSSASRATRWRYSSNQIELLGLPVDGADDGWRQLDAEHQRVENLNRVLQRVVVVLRIGLLHRFGLDQLVEVRAQTPADILPDFFLDDFARRIHLLRGVLRDDLTRLAADFRADDRVDVVRPDEFMQNGDRIVEKLEARADLSRDADAFPGDGVVGRLVGLQAQVVDIELVPRPDQVQAFAAKLLRIEHRAAAGEAPAIQIERIESLPQHADMAGSEP